MKAKRSKQYRKLMRQYSRAWNFKEPYHVLVDAEIVKDASRFKMDLVPALERTVQGKIRPMITQCSMRHLYSQGSEPGMGAVIDYAKETFERWRCGHHPEKTEALSALECLSSVVVDSGKGKDKAYVVASQDEDVRRHMRGVKGVPLIYISRSVMIMEPMSEASAAVVASQERAKFKSELKTLTPAGAKRKREDDDDGEETDDGDDGEGGMENKGDGATAVEQPPKKKKKYGPKGPNPLAAKKKKKKTGNEQQQHQQQQQSAKKPAKPKDEAQVAATTPEPSEKKKRRRRHKKPAAGEGPPDGAVQQSEAGAVSSET